MSVLSTNPRVLLCTVYRRFPGDYLDYVGENVYLNPRVAVLRTASPGLRFLKQNVPELEILEYPMWNDYVKKLAEGWDVVGFSFFQNEIGEVIRMAEEARRHGVKELWAGNYGALDEVIPKVVDRVFLGAAEDKIAQVFGKRVADDAVEHPAALWAVNFYPGNIPYMRTGLLYTQHGCPFKCTFCQTPVFDTKRFAVNLKSIERVLAYYARIGVTDVYILDELFGFNPRHAEEITLLLARYKMRWWAQSRAAIFLHNLDTWHERGLRFPLVGVETMNQQAADSVNKKQKIGEISEFIRRTNEKKGMYRMAYYMIGYEHMGIEETLQDVAKLKQVGFDAHQVNIITPFPRTPLWDETERRYGIFDRAYRHYDAKYLVWNHPHISPKAMDYLLKTTIHTLNKPFDIYVRQFSRLIRQRLQSMGLRFVWRDVIKSPIASAFTNARKQVFFPRLEKTSETRNTSACAEIQPPA